jgi:NAD(P)-dependent dehydrogenase (short-subunit alcohol dehydrogenase family)
MSARNELLKDRVAVITGANQGLGLEIARHYLAAGAKVVLCARDGERLKSACAVLCDSEQMGKRVVSAVADVSREEDVSRVVRLALETFGHVDILVNNAGVYGPKGVIEEVDWREWVRAMEINLMGSVLMCRALLPHFKERRCGKIIQLSGGGATKPLPRLSAYAVSKAAIVRFVETLAEEVRENGIDVNAIAPGSLNTRMLEEVLTAGPEKVGQAFYEHALKQKENGGAPLERGASLAVFLGSSLSDGITGKLIAAMWDPWESLSAHRRDLDKTDVYTLRRIVPKDRGMDWGNDL